MSGFSGGGGMDFPTKPRSFVKLQAVAVSTWYTMIDESLPSLITSLTFLMSNHLTTAYYRMTVDGVVNDLIKVDNASYQVFIMAKKGFKIEIMNNGGNNNTTLSVQYTVK